MSGEYNHINWQSLKASFFGKFYEEIISIYFRTILNWIELSPKTVYWKEHLLSFLIDKLGISTQCSRDIGIIIDCLMKKHIELVMSQIEHDVEIKSKFGEEIVSFIDRMYRSLKVTILEEKRRRYNPDMALRSPNDEFYLLEAKSWSVWLGERKYRLNVDLLLKEHPEIDMADIFCRFLTGKARIEGHNEYLKGHIFVWHGKPSSSEEEQYINKIMAYVYRPLSLEVKIFYLEDIIRDLQKSQGLFRLIEDIRNQINTFLDTLLKGEIWY